jgi:hypothetical protein
MHADGMAQKRTAAWTHRGHQAVQRSAAFQTNPLEGCLNSNSTKGGGGFAARATAAVPAEWTDINVSSEKLFHEDLSRSAQGSQGRWLQDG